MVMRSRILPVWVNIHVVEPARAAALGHLDVLTCGHSAAELGSLVSSMF